MRTDSLYSIAVSFGIGAALLVPDTGARAAIPTVDGPSVGRMHRVLLVDAPTPAAVKPNNNAKQPASSQAQAPVRSGARPAPAGQSAVDGADQQRVRAATALPVR